eukprot:GHVU01165662.1.p1 GENE.GHVU01165662.1~~GHVU01165662.1.p1  ORF type:complete len:159 (+),score=18.05 GHVU01165662.1:788-1264(+)
MASEANNSLQQDVKALYAMAPSLNNEISAVMLKNEKGWSNERIKCAFNKMMVKRMCGLSKTSSDGLVATLRDPSVVQKLQSLAIEDYKVYNAIEDSGKYPCVCIGAPGCLTLVVWPPSRPSLCARIKIDHSHTVSKTVSHVAALPRRVHGPRGEGRRR